MKLEVEVMSRVLPLINRSVAYMLTPAVILLLVAILPFCMAVASTHKFGFDKEYLTSDRLSVSYNLGQYTPGIVIVLRTRLESSLRYC